MWRSASLSVLVLAAIATCRAADDPTASLDGVLDLSPDDFDKYVNGGKHALVEFYAPWCGHCKHLTPEYKKLGAQIAQDGKLKNRVVIAKVDADAHRSLGERFGVQGFPTIKFFPRGAPVSAPEDYQGARNAEAFMSFINGKVASDKGFARIPALDSLAAMFSSSEDTTSVVAKLEDAAKEVMGEGKAAADAYLKYAKKAAEKGADYFTSEYKRLERMLESGSISGKKAGEIGEKLSVLSAFLPEEKPLPVEESAEE